MVCLCEVELTANTLLGNSGQMFTECYKCSLQDSFES